MNFLSGQTPRLAAFKSQSSIAGGVFGIQSRNMATLKEIQIRLKSVKNIGKITKSMKMIASTKLTRAQKNMESARRYQESSNVVFKFIEPKPVEEAVGKTLAVACSSDRGLCGAIHSTISKPIKALCRKDPENTTVVVLGDKARSQISREAPKCVLMSFNSIGKAIPTFAEAASISDLILGSGAAFKDVRIYFNHFKSVIAYELKIINAHTKESILNSEKLAQFELEDDVLENFAEFAFANSLYGSLAEGHASEMSARRTAMENATKNADDMIEGLTMTYNRSRQASITNDLVDIITGASAL